MFGSGLVAGGSERDSSPSLGCRFFNPEVFNPESVPVAQKGKRESGRAIVIGDSLVRGIDRSTLSSL